MLNSWNLINLIFLPTKLNWNDICIVFYSRGPQPPGCRPSPVNGPFDTGPHHRRFNVDQRFMSTDRLAGLPFVSTMDLLNEQNDFNYMTWKRGDYWRVEVTQKQRVSLWGSIDHRVGCRRLPLTAVVSKGKRQRWSWDRVWAAGPALVLSLCGTSMCLIKEKEDVCL